jgi:hypothetical protein
VQLARTSALGSAFSSHAGMKQLGLIVDRITYIGTCELLLQPTEVSLKRPLEICGLSTEIVGALLERQIESLEGSLWKEGVQNVVKALLVDVCGIYPAADMPARRARVLIRCLEFGYRAGSEGSARHPDDVGEEAEELLGRDVRNFSASVVTKTLIAGSSTGSWTRCEFSAVPSPVSHDDAFLVGTARSSTRGCTTDVTCCTPYRRCM